MKKAAFQIRWANFIPPIHLKAQAFLDNWWSSFLAPMGITSQIARKDHSLKHKIIETKLSLFKEPEGSKIYLLEIEVVVGETTIFVHNRLLETGCEGVLLISYDVIIKLEDSCGRGVVPFSILEKIGGKTRASG